MSRYNHFAFTSCCAVIRMRLTNMNVSIFSCLFQWDDNGLTRHSNTRPQDQVHTAILVYLHRLRALSATERVLCDHGGTVLLQVWIRWVDKVVTGLPSVPLYVSSRHWTNQGKLYDIITTKPYSLCKRCLAFIHYIDHNSETMKFVLSFKVFD